MASTTAPSRTADYLSKAFDLRTVGKNRLVLLLGAQRVQFVVLSDLYEVMVYREYTEAAPRSLRDQLDAVAYADELLQEKFASVDVLVNEPRWMLVPAMHVPNGTEGQYLATQYALQAADVPLRDPVRTVGAHLVYASDRALVDRVQAVFQTSALRHAVTPMLVEAQRLHYALRAPHSAGILVVDGGIQLFVTGLFGLLLANEYVAHSTSDAVEAVERAIHACALPVADVKVFLVGRGPLRSDLEQALPRSFPQFASVRPFFAGQPGLNQAGIYHDEFPHLLQRMG